MAGATQDFQIGQEVEWLHEPRGGYGYHSWVPATVVRVTPKRVTIAVQQVRGGTKLVSVTPARLRPRSRGKE